MKLFLNKTSPYARLVLVTAHEAGLAGQIETVWVEPWDNPLELLAVNPAVKVPVLLTDDDVALTESACICDYLSSFSGTGLMPALPARIDTLRRLGLGRAVIDCAFGVVIQRRFKAPSLLVDRWFSALPRLAAALEGSSAGRAAAALDLGDLAVAVGFDYVDFRLPEVAWRRAAPSLAQLVDTLRERGSMTATRPN